MEALSRAMEELRHPADVLQTDFDVVCNRCVIAHSKIVVCVAVRLFSHCNILITFTLNTGLLVTLNWALLTYCICRYAVFGCVSLTYEVLHE